jgi:FkbM family methyltransferase
MPGMITQKIRLTARRVQKLGRILVVPRFRRALRHGVAASTEQLNVPLPENVQTVLDVGANRGQFAVLARERFPAAQLYCFEPLAGAEERLRRVLEGDAASQVFAVALSDWAGSSPMNVAASDDSSSLLSPSDLQTTVFPGTETVAKQDVAVARLVEVLDPTTLKRPSLLKIDVQGAELQVLRGAAEVLHEIDIVLVECSFVELYEGQALADDVIGFLRERRFILDGVYSPSYDKAGRCVQADLLFRAPARG